MMRSILFKSPRRHDRKRSPNRNSSLLPCPTRELNRLHGTSATTPHCFPSVPFQQFQVLFHSLFKVLFIFPSRYLFAIGLPSIFSFRWNLPPIRAAIPNNSTLRRIVLEVPCNPNGAITLSGVPFKRQLESRFHPRLFPLQTTSPKVLA